MCDFHETRSLVIGAGKRSLYLRLAIARSISLHVSRFRSITTIELRKFFVFIEFPFFFAAVLVARKIAIIIMLRLIETSRRKITAKLKIFSPEIV